MHAESAWSVNHLKDHLEDTSGIPATESRIVHAAKELFRGTLAEHKVAADATLHAMLRLNGGAKAKSKGGKSFKKKAKINQKSELIFKEDGQEYAQVAALLGSSRLRLHCADGTERLCKIRGKLVRRAWVGRGDLILVGLREWEDGKCDMIHKYTDDEARNLRAYKEIPANMSLNGDAAGNAEEVNEDVIFGLEEDVDEEIDISGI